MTYNLPIVQSLNVHLPSTQKLCLFTTQSKPLVQYIPFTCVHILDMLGGWFSLNHLRQACDNWLDKPNLCSASRQYRFICALISPELVSYFVTTLSSPKYFNPWKDPPTLLISFLVHTLFDL